MHILRLFSATVLSFISIGSHVEEHLIWTNRRRGCRFLYTLLAEGIQSLRLFYR